MSKYIGSNNKHNYSYSQMVLGLAFFIILGIYLSENTKATTTIGFKNSDFETGNFEGWTVTGDAFGNTPSTGELEGQSEIRGQHGKYFANSFHHEDAGIGSLNSPPITLQGPKIGFLVAGGRDPDRLMVNLRVEGKIVRSATGDNSEKLKRVIWDITEFQGKTGVVEVIDNSQDGWGYILFDDLIMGESVTRPDDFVQPIKILKPLTKRTPITELGKPNVSPELYTIDFDKGGIHMICHSSGFRNFSWYASEGYDVDNYYALQDPIAKDKFNSFAFNINNGGAGSGQICWDTKIPGFQHSTSGNLDTDLLSAEFASLKPGVELLTGGIANALVIKQHPGWQQRDASGRLLEYMGPQVCWNSPYWEENLLPLYRELFTKYGSRISNVILWEGPHDGSANQYNEEAFQKSGMNDRQAWERQETLKKWKELADSIRSTGWKGKIIGGGWAGYEWEEQMWDSTFYNREYHYFDSGLPEYEAFADKAIDGMMPELLIHSNYGPHAYRREDVHYVFRSLMYERSLFGNKIIPNAELFWERAMTPDEVFRWLQEVWMAGYDSYSVVNEGKLYLENFNETQTKYRPGYRNVFSAFNSLPSTGLPELNYQFVVSTSLEAALYHPLPTAFSIFTPDGFGDIQKIQSHSIRRTRTSLDVKENAPCFKLTLDNKDYDLEITVCDDISKAISLWVDYWDGGDWKDYKLGDITLKNTGQFVTQHFDLSHTMIESVKDSYPEQTGKQIAIRIWNEDGTWLDRAIAMEKVVAKEKETGRIACQLNFGESGSGTMNLWDWYVKGTNKLFKEVDRTVGGGALINERLNMFSPQELYGWVTPQTPRVMLLPEGCPEPQLGVPAEHVLKITVKPGEDLEFYKEKIINYLQPYNIHLIRNKTPLVYANWTKTKDGKYYLSVVNHGTVSGMAEVKVPWNEIKPVISSANLLGHSIQYTLKDGWLKITLDSHAGIILTGV